jgi:hypothetical protein
MTCFTGSLTVTNTTSASVAIIFSGYGPAVLIDYIENVFKVYYFYDVYELCFTARALQGTILLTGAIYIF